MVKERLPCARRSGKRGPVQKGENVVGEGKSSGRSFLSQTLFPKGREERGESASGIRALMAQDLYLKKDDRMMHERNFEGQSFEAVQIVGC